jgi:hypothetical protein
MSIKQTINYNSQNSYFAGFLNNLINQSGIEGSVTFEDRKITLLLSQNDPQKLETFTKLVNKYLPHSIFLGDIETLETKELAYKKPFKSETYNISLCAKCMEKLLDPASDNYLDDSLLCNHYENTPQSYSDANNFSPHYADGSTLLVVDSSKVDELFILTDDEKKVLFSIEKPTIKVTIQDEELKALTKRNFIYIKSVYNTKSALVAINAKESGMSYLFFSDTNPSIAVVVQKNTLLIEDTKFSKKLETLNEDKVLNRFLNIKKEATYKNAIGAYMSKQNGISFLVSNDVGTKKVLNLQQFSLEKIFEDILKDEKKSKLLTNFENKYPTIIATLKQNLNLNLFETLATILELDDISFYGLSDKSLEFRGNGGLKIDAYFNDTGFDYLSFIGSVMSFKLARTDDSYLAYSIFEAFGDMIISNCNQLKSTFNIENFIMMGDMFENNILYSRILSKFQLSNPYFSKDIAFDGN